MVHTVRTMYNVNYYQEYGNQVLRMRRNACASFMNYGRLQHSYIRLDRKERLKCMCDALFVFNGASLHGEELHCETLRVLVRLL